MMSKVNRISRYLKPLAATAILLATMLAEACHEPSGVPPEQKKRLSAKDFPILTGTDSRISSYMIRGRHSLEYSHQDADFAKTHHVEMTEKFEKYPSVYVISRNGMIFDAEAYRGWTSKELTEAYQPASYVFTSSGVTVSNALEEFPEIWDVMIFGNKLYNGDQIVFATPEAEKLTAEVRAKREKLMPEIRKNIPYTIHKTGSPETPIYDTIFKLTPENLRSYGIEFGSLDEEDELAMRDITGFQEETVTITSKKDTVFNFGHDEMRVLGFMPRIDQ
jgi:hypothetical protein